MRPRKGAPTPADENFATRVRFGLILHASIELAAWSGLVGTDAARGNLRLKVVLPFDRTAGETSEHGNLTDVSQGICDWPLQQALGRGAKRL